MRIDPLRLYRYAGSNGLTLLLCEICFILYIFVFIVATVNRWRTIGSREYFTSFWTLIDLSMLVLMIGTAVLYVFMHISTSSISNDVLETGGNEYLNIKVSLPQLLS